MRGDTRRGRYRGGHDYSSGHDFCVIDSSAEQSLLNGCSEQFRHRPGTGATWAGSDANGYALGAGPSFERELFRPSSLSPSPVPPTVLSTARPVSRLSLLDRVFLPGMCSVC